MADRYFRCIPKDCGSSCCSSRDTAAVLTLGDYIRISDIERVDIESLWRENGMVSLANFPGMPDGQYLISLGLLHDPCPYLSDKKGCTIYDSRPISCAGFPGLLYLGSKDVFKSIERKMPCLRGNTLDQDAQNLSEELKDLGDVESFATVEYFWKKPACTYVRDFYELCELGQRAFELQLTRDPKQELRKTIRLGNVIMEMIRLLKSDAFDGSMEIGDLEYYTASIYTAMMEDDLAQRMRRISPEAKTVFYSTTARYMDLLERL